MTTNLFLALLTIFATISSLVTECVKKVFEKYADKYSTNIIATVVALIVGGCGTGIYYQLNAIPFTVNNIIYLILMGLASALTSMVGFDKIRQSIEQINTIS